MATLVVIEPTFPKRQWPSAEETPWGEDGETHASRRGQSSCSSFSRHSVSHTLIQGLQGDGGT